MPFFSQPNGRHDFCAHVSAPRRQPASILYNTFSAPQQRDYHYDARLSRHYAFTREDGLVESDDDVFESAISRISSVYFSDIERANTRKISPAIEQSASFIQRQTPLNVAPHAASIKIIASWLAQAYFFALVAVD